MSVCQHCKHNLHLNGKPANCPGGTWCDCQHRKVVLVETPVHYEEVKVESNGDDS